VVVINDGRRTNPVPMVVDTGSDHCVFSPDIAALLGIDVTLGQASRTKALGGTVTSFVWPPPLYMLFPDIDLTFRVIATFAPLPPGTNGLLGSANFLNNFRRVVFVPRDRFELTLRDGFPRTVDSPPR
jgi:hypothetical protein